MALRQYYEPKPSLYELHYAESSSLMAIIPSPLATDASPSIRPSQTTRIVVDDEVDYYEPSSADDVNLWLRKIGDFAAKYALHRSEVKGREACVLMKLPAGYKLYTHKKGSQHDPRSDHYLYGSRYVRSFRSPAEFFLHFHWIIAGMPLDDNNKPDCPCTWCSGVPQGEISSMYSKYTKRKYPALRTPTDDVSKEEQERQASMKFNDAPAKKQKKKKEPKPKEVPIMFKDYTKLASTSTSQP